MSEGSPTRSSQTEGRRRVFKLAAYLVSPHIEAAATQVEGAVDRAHTRLQRISTNLELATHVAAPQSRKDFLHSLVQLVGSGEPPIHQPLTTEAATHPDEATFVQQTEDHEEPELEITTEPELSSRAPEPDNDQYYQEKPIFDL